MHVGPYESDLVIVVVAVPDSEQAWYSDHCGIIKAVKLVTLPNRPPNQHTGSYSGRKRTHVFNIKVGKPPYRGHLSSLMSEYVENKSMAMSGGNQSGAVF